MLIDEKLATKQDLKELEMRLVRDMKELETNLKRDMQEMELRLKHDMTLRPRLDDGWLLSAWLPLW